jgi:heme/copper-type cytochrome/quinol oxidase subunit 3
VSDVTRSGAGGDAVAAAYVDRRRRAMPNGMWGMTLLIATEATLFGTLIATYFYLRFETTRWPPPGVEHPTVALPLALTGALVIAGVPMLRAVRSARLGDAARTRLWLVLALLIQGAYLGLQLHEYLRDLARFSPKDSAYGSIYFTLLGVHHAHVAVGILLSLWLLGRLLGGLTNYRLVALRAITAYWLFVSAAGVCVVLTQLYPSL